MEQYYEQEEHDVEDGSTEGGVVASLTHSLTHPLPLNQKQCVSLKKGDYYQQRLSLECPAQIKGDKEQGALSRRRKDLVLCVAQ